MAGTERLYGLHGDEHLLDDPHAVAVRAREDGMAPPLTIEEFTTKPVRSFVRSVNVIDHVVEYDLEEALDDYGDVSERLAERAKDPAIVALFDAALDALLADIGWCWADELVATWVATWDPDDEDTPALNIRLERTARRTT